MPRLFQLVFIALHRTVFRLSGGRMMSKINGMDVLLLTTQGRRSGKQRSLPIGYIRDGDAYAVCAGEATIEVGAAKFAVAVENAEPALRDTLYARFKETSGVFAGYEEKTDRTFPVLVLRPIAGAA